MSSRTSAVEMFVAAISVLILGVEFAILLTLLQVRHLHWGGQDQTLVSCGQDGAVYQWDVDEAKRLGEFVQKGTAYSCALRYGRRALSASIVLEIDRIGYDVHSVHTCVWKYPRPPFVVQEKTQTKQRHVIGHCVQHLV